MPKTRLGIFFFNYTYIAHALLLFTICLLDNDVEGTQILAVTNRELMLFEQLKSHTQIW